MTDAIQRTVRVKKSGYTGVIIQIAQSVPAVQFIREAAHDPGNNSTRHQGPAFAYVAREFRRPVSTIIVIDGNRHT
ncbi:hypothetical protein ACFQZI_14920 [Mucilaginibacter lutimaris]|uniref:Uncharacterized protein n=1 Tax=Mucilaginibacter lutimaris TaxID=931629 RepID=A0ABW2ZIU3_9SPHI